MNVAEFLSSNHSTAFSIEVLPPVRGKSIEQVFKTIERLLPFNPAYINITTHRTEVVYKEISEGVFQRTTERMRPGTVAIAAALKERYGIPTVPHMICSGFSRSELENELIDLSYLGITDLLILRGDRAKGENRFIPMQDGHEHALDLCHQVEDFNNGLMIDGCIGRRTMPLLGYSGDEIRKMLRLPKNTNSSSYNYPTWLLFQ